MIDPCKICGRDMAMKGVGRAHYCVPPRVAKMSGVVTKDEPATMANTPPPAENMANATYRYRDAENRRAYMREYMRARRAALAQEGNHAG